MANPRQAFEAALKSELAINKAGSVDYKEIAKWLKQKRWDKLTETQLSAAVDICEKMAAGKLVEK